MKVRVLASTATDVRGVQALAAAHGLPCTVELLGMGSEAERSHYRELKAQHDWHNLPMVFLDERFVGGEPELANALGGRNAGEATAASVARVLGYGGLLPFFALALATVLGWEAWTLDTRGWLTAYAATILSFVGAVHWGVAVAQPALPARRTWLAASVLPALIAWVALGLPAPVDLWVMVAAFVGWYAWERNAAWDVLPAWYRQLRTALTTGVTLTLALVAIWA
ncbi:MAG: DUF3429 domain-containing protein [Pseudomonadota bacterium]